MLRIEDLQLFVRAVEAGSLSGAARALDCSPAVASAALARLETELGQRLLLRTTRTVRLSPAGERLLPHARRTLLAIDDVRSSITTPQTPLCGPVRISVPSDIGRHQLRQWIDAFQTDHPSIQLRLQVGDRLSNLFREPVDAAIRYGSPNDDSLIARELAPDNRRCAVAAPDYLADAGAIDHPQALGEQECLLYTVADRADDRWVFENDRRRVEVTVSGSRVAEDGEVVRRWAVEGYGIACLSQLDVAADLAAGRLRLVLPTWQGERVPLYFVTAVRSESSSILTALREHLLRKLGQSGHSAGADTSSGK